MKTSELTGGRLDYWVAKAEGRAVDYHDLGAHGGDFVTVVDPEQSGWVSWSPSRSWSDGGRIIERERITIAASKQGWGWLAYTGGYWLNEALQDFDVEEYGETYLEAAMRAYVASKFGDEVPDA
ncbi:hypothetical protein J2W35_003284 [Variovorax boronicumulans]|uniref:phage protein NinX family protein n=1 Tax=Variovorax boronicumulans TaxID=436515 RepID=UPI00278971C0|nr:phage protein NinX family protein [Variovorax boronicumulans]MDQ0082925.1 hypothetical protein [Variovorax boronicumulans]